MLFNSYSFIFLFLPVVLLGYFQLARITQAYAAAWLALSSLFFYGYWNPAYVGLLLGSIVCNYAFGMWIAKAGVQPAAAGLLQICKLFPVQCERPDRLQSLAG
ncbi:MAG: hypothetical protein Fur0026_04220 [Sideroxydans sp.]